MFRTRVFLSRCKLLDQLGWFIIHELVLISPSINKASFIVHDDIIFGKYDDDIRSGKNDNGDDDIGKNKFEFGFNKYE